MSTTARRASALTATVRALAPFVTELTRTDRPLTRTANLATPTLRTLAPVTPLMLPALRSIEQLAPQLGRTFHSLPPALRGARADLGPAATLVRTLPSLGATLDAAGRQLVPLVALVQAYDHDAVDSLASFGSVLEPTKGTAGSTFSRYARTAIVLTSEGNLGYAHREPWNRYNPYPPPGALGDGKSLGCANTVNPETTPDAGSQLPCVAEAPWSFRGVKRSFPLLTPYAPAPLPRR
jgi:ABC-type transporter Mla subunit MlaD